MHTIVHVRPVLTLLTVAAILVGAPAQAQAPAQDASERLRQVLPAAVADHVLATIAEVRGRELPAQGLENRTLKFAARGIAPAEIERAIREHAVRLGQSRDALATGRAQRPAADEVEAGAEVIRLGVDGEAVSALAASAPAGRSLAVALFVVGSLVERGLPSDAALTSVSERLQTRASDSDLEQMASEFARSGAATRPEIRPAGAQPSRPDVVPATGGQQTRPTRPPATNPIPIP